MPALQTTLRALASQFGLSSATNSAPAKTTAAEPPSTDDQVFLASLVGLSLQEQRRRIEIREWYQRLAIRQGIVEAEQNAEYYRHSG